MRHRVPEATHTQDTGNHTIEMSKRGAANEFLLGEDGLNAAPAQGRVTTSLLITAAIGALNSGQYGACRYDLQHLCCG